MKWHIMIVKQIILVYMFNYVLFCFRLTGLKRSPFGQTSLRFEKQHHVKRTPGFKFFIFQCVLRLTMQHYNLM